jgi:hypothetical protein
MNLKIIINNSEGVLESGIGNRNLRTILIGLGSLGAKFSAVITI